MKRRILDLREQAPLLDVVSYGRRGPGDRPLSKAEVAHISRTARRVPEVVVKVSGGARTLRGVQEHLDYIGREGKGKVETDDGRLLQGKGFEKEVVKDWDLDLQVHRRYMQRTATAGRRPPKLVHNLVFSMPRDTPSDKLLAAARRFALEKFALQHRYVMTLHTDQGHPHVHMAVKAISERGVRLNIRKATLREWRRDFAQYLLDLGIEANATERAVRGEAKTRKTDDIHRATLHGDSTHMHRRATEVVRELAAGQLTVEPGKRTIMETRREVTAGWFALAGRLDREGHRALAETVRGFAHTMPPPRTDKEVIADRLRGMDRTPSIGARTL
ncbi:MAG: relaxase/mobilization nuclease domain-containing protein [Methylocella sp.]